GSRVRASPGSQGKILDSKAFMKIKIINAFLFSPCIIIKVILYTHAQNHQIIDYQIEMFSCFRTNCV
ncbi:MAG: hypothetical protein J6V74_06580, partial [Bacteroidales bacterium]|nr:hypothetical protein [Bacteroidales bacterium]